MERYTDFCLDCVNGKVENRKKFYFLDKPKNSRSEGEKDIEISVVTPTQAAVEQAKSEIQQEKPINRADRRSYFQKGGRGGRHKIKKAKQKISKKIVKKTKKKILKKKGKIKAKGKARKKKKILKSKKSKINSLWM